MVAILNEDYRGGNVKEDLGILLLKAFCAVSPVPRTEDVGIDAVATLLRRGPKRPDVEGNKGRAVLFAEDTFCVQLKSESVADEIKFEGYQTEWLLQQRLPMFINVVNQDSFGIDLYTTHFL